MPNVKSHGLGRGTLRDTQKMRACNFNAWRVICMSVFDGCMALDQRFAYGTKGICVARRMNLFVFALCPFVCPVMV